MPSRPSAHAFWKNSAAAPDHFGPEAHDIRTLADDLPQHGLALGQGDLAQVVVVSVHHIEREVRERGPGCRERVLQRLEARASLRIQRAYFAVDPRRFHGQRRKRLCNRLERGGPLLAVARIKARPAALDARHHSIAVVLYLGEPLVALRRPVDERRQLWRNERRQRRAPGACGLRARTLGRLHAARASRHPPSRWPSPTTSIAIRCRAPSQSRRGCGPSRRYRAPTRTMGAAPLDRACASFSLMSSHACLPLPLYLPPPVRMRFHRPCSFLPSRSNLRCPFA